jgi:4-hydroxybenzoyl-CoA reductase subunit alpha
VPKVWIAHDIGRALNPPLVRGQVEGSVYMALGEALMEEQEFRRLPPRLSDALVHKFPSMLEYKSPTTLDMPEVITELVEYPDPRGPFGAKEVGQGPLLPVMPALANAVYDAVGVRIDEVPITPEKIVKALQAKAAGKPARYGPTHFPDVAWPESLRVPPPWEGGDGRAVNDRGKNPKKGRSVEAPAAMPAPASAKRDAGAKALPSGGGAPRESKQ